MSTKWAGFGQVLGWYRGGDARPRQITGGAAMTTLIFLVLLGGWTLLFALLAVLPLLPALPREATPGRVAGGPAGPMRGPAPPPVADRRAA